MALLAQMGRYVAPKHLPLSTGGLESTSPAENVTKACMREDLVAMQAV